MPSHDPHRSEDWGFMDDESDAWYEALETVEDEEGNKVVDIDHYDEFANIQELVNFVAGTGSYSDTRRFTPGQEDLQEKKREMKNTHWKLPDKLEQIDEYLEQGAMRGEIDIDPAAKAKWNISETEANLDDAEIKYTAHFIVYDPENRGEENSHFYISGSWYDTPPEEMNFEQIFASLFTKE